MLVLARKTFSDEYSDVTYSEIKGNSSLVFDYNKLAHKFLCLGILISCQHETIRLFLQMKVSCHFKAVSLIQRLREVMITDTSV